MTRGSRTIAGVVAAALFTAASAAPADARPRGHWHHGHNDVDAGDVLAGIAIIGGLFAIASAASRNRERYEPSYARNGSPYRVVVNSCGYEADEAYGRGNVRVTDVEQVGRDTFRVSGVVERGGGYYGREEPAAYEEEPAGESSAVIGEERYYDSGARARERAEQQRGDDSFSFSCTALGNGRIVEFAANDR